MVNVRSHEATRIPAATKRPMSHSSQQKKKGTRLLPVIVLVPLLILLIMLYANVRILRRHRQNHFVSRQESALSCKDSNRDCKCFQWNLNNIQSNPDQWWIDHPTWDIVVENDQGYCLQPITDRERAIYLEKVHQLQWHGNCSQDLQTHQINSGFGASVATQAEVFCKVMQRERPYQMTKHWDGMHWLYVPQDNSSWAWCESTDLNCYILPISKCPPVYGRHDRIPSREKIQNQTHLLWITWHLSRLRHHVRRRVYQTIQQQFPPLSIPCTVMHVRRSDAGFAQMPFRRYAALSEYVEVGHVQPGEKVVLLTDDHSTIVEAQEYHPTIDWKYVQRPRQNATSGGPNGHIPSGDPAFDTLMILSELQYASRCTKLVHGNSVFVRQIEQSLQRAGVAHYTKYYLNTSVSKEEARQHKGAQRGEVLLDAIRNNYLNATA